MHDCLLHRASDAVRRHAGAEPLFKIRHAFFRAFESHGAAQFLGFAAAESSGDHRHLQQLLLKQRHAERAAQHRLERRVQAIGRFPALAPVQIRMHHFAHDRPRPDDRHLHHDVVKAARLHARQTGHLRAAFHLEHADGVGLLERPIHRRIVLRQARQIHRFAVNLGNHFQAVLDHRHHAQAEQIHLDDPHIGAVFLVPLDDHAAGHGGGFERHHRIQLPLANDHAARMLAEVPRHVLRHFVELAKFAHARMGEIQAGLAKLAVGRVFRISPLPRMRQFGKFFERGNLEAQRLAHFARGGAAAIGDDVGGHGRAQLSEALVHVLDYAFALFAAGQIEIDIGPFAALFGEEAFEQQIHADRVHGGDFERITDRAVGGRAAALRQNAARLGEAHDVPDDQEIAGQLELFDQRQFALDLPLRAVVVGLVAAARAFVHARAQKAGHGFARGHGIARKFVTETVEREFQTRRDFERIGQRLGQVGEQAHHFRWSFDVAFGIALEQAAGAGKRHMIADAGEHIQQLALGWRGVGGAVGGDQRDAQTPRAFDDGLVGRFLFPPVVALQFCVHVGAAEDIEQLRLGMTGEADQAAREFGQLIECGRAFALLGAQLDAGDQPAEVLIAFARGRQQRVRVAVGASDFRANMGANAGLFRRHVKARRAIDAVAVQKSHGGRARLRAGSGHLFRHRSAFEKAETGACVQFHVHRAKNK